LADLQLYGYTPAKRETVLGCRCRGTEQQICTVRLHSRQKGRPYWAVQVPGHRAADLHCTVTLPPKRETVLGCMCQSTDQQICIVRLYSRRKGDRTGLYVPEHRSADLHCTVVLPPKRETALGCTGAGAPISRSALYGCTPAKRGTVLGCRCQSTDQQICIVRLYPRQKGDRTGLKMPGHRSADLRCTVVLPQKGRPYSTVGARAPSSRSELYGCTPAKEGDRPVLGCTGAGAPISRSELYGYTPVKKGDRTGL